MHCGVQLLYQKRCHPAIHERSAPLSGTTGSKDKASLTSYEEISTVNSTSLEQSLCSWKPNIAIIASLRMGTCYVLSPKQDRAPWEQICIWKVNLSSLQIKFSNRLWVISCDYQIWIWIHEKSITYIHKATQLDDGKEYSLWLEANQALTLILCGEQCNLWNLQPESKG